MSGIRRNEQGMVSILVTMIMIIVISLIVLGFAEVTRRNAREALDTQLSSEAYYAAESGVNVAASYFTSNPDTPIDTTGDCTHFLTSTLGGTPGTTNILSGDPDKTVQYTCLMVNSEPTSLIAKSVQQDANTVWHVANAAGAAAPFSSLTFQWKQDPTSTFGFTCNAGAGTLPSYGSWNCPYGILRVDLVDASSVSNAAFQGNSGVLSLYLVPSTVTGGSSATLQAPIATGAGSCSAAGNNCPVQIVHVNNCNTGSSPTSCTFTLNIASGASANYYARLTMLYQDAGSVMLTGKDGSGAAVKFAGGQAIIDSTGRAQDELRRIQARIPLGIASQTPAYALQSTDTVCKQLSVAAGIYDDSSCPAPTTP